MAERQAQRLRTMLEIAMGYFRGSILMMGALLMLTGQNVTTVLAGALFILGRLTDPFLQLGSNSEEVAQGLAAWRRLRGLVDGSGLPPDGLCFPCPEGRLVVERLSFTYKGPAPTLLRNIDLVVEPGEVVAIVGPSGSGKSTLLRLLIGMYKSGSGGVYLDGHSTGQWDRRDLARHLGFLPQEPTLSRGTAAEVISRLETPDMSLVLEASRRAGAHEAIIALPNGYATQISGNYQFSMGQRHRVALARAIYGRPRVLVLDELAGSLDAEGEAHVARLLGTLREEGTSVIFTTHRPGLLAVADRVLALRGGSLVPAQEEAIPRLPPRQARLTQSPLIKEAAA
jgi:ABC-type protease/lipase transport system fused ATPase/permease subunit